MKIKSIRNAKELKNKTVLVRVDFNVPVEKNVIKEDYKIRAANHTIKFLLDNGCKVILVTHFKEPEIKDGKIVDQAKYSVANLAKAASKIIGKKIKFLSGCVEPEIVNEIKKMKAGEIVMLENLRFYPGEKKNDNKFAKKLARLADLYVNEAFGVSHRAHASVSAIKKYVDSYAGFLLEQEVLSLERILHPRRPLVVVMGGAKITTKLPLMKKMLQLADYMLIGGGIANTLLALLGYEVGKSLVDQESINSSQVKSFCNKFNHSKIILPLDAIVAQKGDGSGKIVVRKINNIKKSEFIFDIGPETISFYASFIRKANTIVWNGPLGMFENKVFKHGTAAIASVISSRSQGRAFGLVGGGETVEALHQSGHAEGIDWISTGGGATLSFLGGEKMPGLKGIVN